MPTDESHGADVVPTSLKETFFHLQPEGIHAYIEVIIILFHFVLNFFSVKKTHLFALCEHFYESNINEHMF